MMQHLAAQKTEIASPIQIGKSTVGSEQQDNSRRQDFASMLEQSRAAERQTTAKVSNQNKGADSQDSSTKVTTRDNPQEVSDKQTEQTENVKKGEEAAQSESKEATTQDSSNASSDSQSEQEQTQTADAQNIATDDAGQEQPEQTESGDQVKSEKDKVKEQAVHFDWLAMLDKIHGQNVEGEATEQSIKSPEEPHTVVDLQKALAELVTSSETDVSEESVGVSDVNVDVPDDQPQEGEAENQTLSDILALIESLSEEENVSAEALQELDQMIDDFMAANPALENSPLKELKGEDWLKLDARLLTQVLQTPVKEEVQATPVEINIDDEFAKNLMKSEPVTVRNVAEYIANNLIPKEMNTPEVRETFIDKLKAGVEEMKAQLKQGHEPGMDLGQVVKDALAAATDTAAAGTADQAKLQQVLAAANSTLDVANQLTESKVVNNEAAKTTTNTTQTSTKELNVAQLEANRQQQANQIERTVNMHKPDAPQSLADKVQLMVNQKNMVADIRLDPPDLGSMKVKINMSGETASVNFIVQTQHAREALEQATPRLKELLDEQGIELGQSSVEQEARQQQDAEQANGKLAGGKNGDDIDEEDFSEAQTVRVVNGSVNGIDYFA